MPRNTHDTVALIHIPILEGVFKVDTDEQTWRNVDQKEPIWGSARSPKEV